MRNFEIKTSSDQPCFTVQIVDSISSVISDDWDEAAHTKPLASYGWLLSTEQKPRPGRRYCIFLAMQANRLVAAFHCTIERFGESRTSIAQTLFGVAAGIATAIYFHGHAVIIVQKRIMQPDLPIRVRTSLNKILTEAVEEKAQDLGAIICFRQVNIDESGLGETLNKYSYAESIDLPLTTLDLPEHWSSFADYQLHLKKLHPAMESSIRRELNLGRRNGLEIEVTCNSERFPLLFKLLNDHSIRLNSTPLPYDTSFLQRLRENLGDRLVISAASVQNRPIAVSIGIRSGSSMAFPMIGVNHEQSPRALPYFNLGYNHNIKACIELGIRHVHFGTYAFSTKIQRGCRLVDSLLYVRSQNRIVQAILNQVMEFRSRRMRTKFGLQQVSHPQQKPG